MRKLMLLAAAASLLALTVFAPAAMAASPTLPVHGKVMNSAGTTVGTFSGQITDLTAGVVKTDSGKVLTTSGHLTGTITKESGKPIPVDKTFSTKTQAKAACNILTLDIGAIHLDLLGLVIDLSPIHLDVTAVPGAGNLLGNLLCAVAGLLDPSSALATFINNLLAALALL